MTLDRLWPWIAIALPAFVALLVPMPAVDLAYQVRAGDEILASGALPAVDTWTFTVAGTPWVDQQWLAQIALAAGYAIGGWELLAVIRALLVAALTGLLIAVARERGVGPRTASILALVAFAIAAPALALRPQLYGIVLFALLLWMISTRHRAPRLFLLAPGVVALWANLHGSFVLGPALLAYAWLDDLAAGRPSQRSLAVFVAGTLATLVNPYLVGAWTYAIGIGANPAIAGQVSEWQRTVPWEMPGLLFYPALVITILLGWRRRRALRSPDWVLLAAVAAMGAWAVRGVAWWAPVMVVILGAALAPVRSEGASVAPSRPRRASALNGTIAVGLGVALAVALPWWRPADPLTGREGLLSYAPSGLALALREVVQPGDRVVVPQVWGSWFEWAVPDARYFIDSRFELFPAEAWADEALIFAGGDRAAAVLTELQVSVLALPPGAPAPGGRWSAVRTHADGRVFVRAD